MSIRVLVADDNTLIRKQIRSIVESDTELEVCAEAVSGLKAVEKAQQFSPDVAVIEFSDAGDGWLKSNTENKATNAISAHFAFHTVQLPQLEWESKQARADAVLLKAEGSTHLPEVIHSLFKIVDAFFLSSGDTN